MRATTSQRWEEMTFCRLTAGQRRARNGNAFVRSRGAICGPRDTDNNRWPAGRRLSPYRGGPQRDRERLQSPRVVRVGAIRRRSRQCPPLRRVLALRPGVAAGPGTAGAPPVPMVRCRVVSFDVRQRPLPPAFGVRPIYLGLLQTWSSTMRRAIWIASLQRAVMRSTSSGGEGSEPVSESTRQ